MSILHTSAGADKQPASTAHDYLPVAMGDAPAPPVPLAKEPTPAEASPAQAKRRKRRSGPGCRCTPACPRVGIGYLFNPDPFSPKRFLRGFGGKPAVCEMVKSFPCLQCGADLGTACCKFACWMPLPGTDGMVRVLVLYVLCSGCFRAGRLLKLDDLHPQDGVRLVVRKVVAMRDAGQLEMHQIDPPTAYEEEIIPRVSVLS